MDHEQPEGSQPERSPLLSGSVNATTVVRLLGGITFDCVLALIYEVIETGHDGALGSMSNIAMIGVGSLATLLGVSRTGDSGD